MEKLVQTTTLQQPKPRPPKRSHASFLEDCVDPGHIHPVESVNTTISEWLGSIGSDTENRCRSDSHLCRSDSSPIPRQATRPAPEMPSTWDADGFAIPPTPSTGSRSYTANTDARSVAPSDVTGSGRSSSRSLVEDTFYRSRNLAVNGIYMRNVDEDFPGDIARLVYDVGKERGSPGPPPAQVRHDAALHQLEMGAEEPDVEQYFRTNLYPYPKPTESLKRSDKQPMSSGPEYKGQLGRWLFFEFVGDENDPSQARQARVPVPVHYPEALNTPCRPSANLPPQEARRATNVRRNKLLSKMGGRPKWGGGAAFGGVSSRRTTKSHWESKWRTRRE